MATLTESWLGTDAAWDALFYTLIAMTFLRLKGSHFIIHCMISTYLLVFYTLAWPLGLEWNYIYSCLVLSGILFYIIGNIVLDKLYAGDTYTGLGTYLCFPEPIRPEQYAAALFNCGRGSCILVKDGKECSFHRGVVIKSDHIPQDGHKYRLIKSVNWDTFNGIVGTRWSVIGNCFAFFRKI